jgi:hypothetical protein
VYQFNLIWQKLVKAMAHNRVCLPTADFHDHPGLGHNPPDFMGGFTHQFNVAVFADEFHCCSAEG